MVSGIRQIAHVAGMQACMLFLFEGWKKYRLGAWDWEIRDGKEKGKRAQRQKGKKRVGDDPCLLILLH